MKKIMLPLSLLLAATGSVYATPTISAQSIIVNPVTSDVQVKVWTDRDATGKKTPNYAIDDAIRVYTTVDQDAYVYLFSVSSDGSIDQILPNNYTSGDNFIKAGSVKTFPDKGDKFVYNIAGPVGISKVLALASTTKLDLGGLSSFKSDQKLATVSVKGQQNLAQALSIVVNPVPDKSWSTDVALLNVVPKPVAQAPAPATTTTTTTTTITIRPYTDAKYARPTKVDNGSGYIFRSSAQVDDLLKYYSAQLIKAGYVQDDQTLKRDSAVAHFSQGSTKTTLTIKNTAGKVEVSVVSSN
ncbi:DUF4384 domain-containing protein [Deinococcus psychrotolerans]|uniref:DUF4384 domain-containing protein n=1 Tax=Deinococcus psychrotolerans TaxID=2489213 RepID=A0A3G8Y9H2_9DEIO|nr:DUF4384 domain-containing protein [Deinococcus psychrotolerans]AZI42009.1 DUF4384 domain-containing protein [Deinococcus psychrotolerans]